MRAAALARPRVALIGLWLAGAPAALAADLSALVRGYPEFLDRVDGNALVWRDGTRMDVDDGKGPKSPGAMIDAPDIKDMLAMPYPAGRSGIPPGRDADPGRVRYAPLFDKIYGNCLAGGVRGTLEPVAWMPSKGGGKVLVSRINGAAARLREVVADLERLPDRFHGYLVPSAGTFNCRPIAGTKRVSAHGYGIAIDIATKHSHYWRWTKADAAGTYPYRNEIPWEIVEIFERHGWIWGGKWYHYDTMHFEFRPELLAQSR